MAVQPWELGSDRVAPAPKPKLELVPAPPRGGRVIPALLFVTLLIGAIGWPSIHAAIEGPPQVRYESPRPAPVSQIASLDRLREMPRASWPTGSEPLGGLLFVRCTNLWTALPDGSGARKLLAFPGISSPAISPDARTIAFIGPDRLGSAIYMAGSDGSNVTRVGALTWRDTAIAARVTNLTWAENGSKLAFALVDPSFDPMHGGATIWTWDPRWGALTHVDSGYPTPGFIGGQVAYARPFDRSSDQSASFASPGDSNGTGNLSSSKLDDLSFGAAPSRFSDAWATGHGAIVLRRSASGDLELAVKGSVWERRVKRTFEAPSPYSFFSLGRQGVSQDARFATADLVDPKGDRAVGILDLASGGWTVMDYAWSAVPTPAPTITGPLGQSRVVRLAQDIFGSWRRNGPGSAAAVMIGRRDRHRIDLRQLGAAIGQPVRTGDGWRVPATVYSGGRRDHEFQTAVLAFHATKDRRLDADLASVSSPQPLRTMEDARRFLASLVGGPYPWPSYLPEGTRLNTRWPVSASSYDGMNVATVNLELPRGEGRRFTRTLSISHGDVSFNLGCGDGGATDPDVGEVTGQPALFDSMGEREYRMTQVIWPATTDTLDSATHSVYGYLPRSEIERIANSMTD